MFESVFVSEDPYGSPFPDRLPHRALLYSVEYWFDDRWDDLVRAAVVAGDARAFGCLITYLQLSPEQIAELERLDREDDAWFRERGISVASGPAPPGWEIELGGTALEWDDTIIPYDHALFPASGRWGILLSDENHAVVGAASASFIDAIAPRGRDHDVPDYLALLAGFREHSPSARVAWVPGLLGHLFGDERAHTLLASSSLADLLER